MKTSLIAMLASAGSGAGAAPAWTGFVPFIGMFVILWFFILRPQMKKQKDHQSKIAGIKKGDQVLTGGGLLGKVVKVDDLYAEVELGQNVRVKALKSTIADIVPPPGSTAAND
jgi:preprotein translocase subunit YajC